MICISSARSYEPECYFLTSANERISSAATIIKVLGFTFGREPNVKIHVGLLLNKFKSRIWALRHLKKNGFTNENLVLVYKSMIRPLVEYCSCVYHSLITLSDSLELDRLQMQALKTIFGWRLSYRSLLEKSGLERLCTRREAAFHLLAKEMSESIHYTELSPLNPERRPGLRTREKYKVYTANTNRYLNSPLNSMRHFLNGLYES